VISFTPRPYTSQRRKPQYPLYRRRCSQICYECGEEGIFCASAANARPNFLSSSPRISHCMHKYV